MAQEFIPYEQALELKKLGFDESCLSQHYHNPSDYTNVHLPNDLDCPIPLYQQAFRWFREKYNLPCWVYTSNSEEFWYSVLKDGRMLNRNYVPFNTYEEAELACIIKLIEIVKNK